MKFLIIMLMLMALALTGCDVNPSKFGSGEAKKFATKITYVKDHRTDLCFALVASRKTGTASQSGMGIAQVPCTAVADYLENQPGIPQSPGEVPEGGM